MPQVQWPTRSIPCGTLALAANVNHFYVRKSDRNFLPEGKVARYIRTVSNTEIVTAGVTVHLHPTLAASYQLRESNGDLIDPVAPTFRLEFDAGVVVNYHSRPILKAPALQMNETLTNPRRVSAYDIGGFRYEGSCEMQVTRDEDAGVIEAFVDELHDPRNWFEIPLPGDHLGESSVTSYDSVTRNIGISVATEDNLHGWWVRVGNRTGRITWHGVAVLWISNAHAYTHTIRIVPSELITSTGGANNFARHETMRVRATSVAATGDVDYAGSWHIDFVETDGDN